MELFFHSFFCFVVVKELYIAVIVLNVVLSVRLLVSLD